MLHTSFKKILPSLLVCTVIICLYYVFSGQIILPQIFSVGSITIHYYGIIMALAVAGGFYLAEKRSEKYGIKGAAAQNVLFCIIVGGFVGARLYHVFSSFGYYQHNVIDIFKVWNGGLSIYGAIIGGLIALFLYRRLDKDALWQPKGIFVFFVLLDWLTPSLIVGQIIGRFGNLFNYEAFGYPTNLPWKMFVPLEFRKSDFASHDFFHPWFLYEQIGLLIVFLIVRKSEKSEKNHLFLWYLLLYNILRFGLEFLRVDSTFIGSFRLNSLTSFILIIISGALITRKRKLESV